MKYLSNFVDNVHKTFSYDYKIASGIWDKLSYSPYRRLRPRGESEFKIETIGPHSYKTSVNGTEVIGIYNDGNYQVIINEYPVQHKDLSEKIFKRLEGLYSQQEGYRLARIKDDTTRIKDYKKRKPVSLGDEPLEEGIINRVFRGKDADNGEIFLNLLKNNPFTAGKSGEFYTANVGGLGFKASYTGDFDEYFVWANNGGEGRRLKTQYYSEKIYWVLYNKYLEQNGTKKPEVKIKTHRSQVDRPVLENKMWYKSIESMVNWLHSKSDKTWIWIDTETTGLGGPTKTQLTQVSGLATKWNPETNTFTEVGQFNEKIKLTPETKSKFNIPGDRTKWVLGFNHYGDVHPTKGKFKFKDEKEIIDAFYIWMEEFDDPFMIIQNASFDMNMLGGRYGHKTKHEVFDTKRLIQLYYLPGLQKLAETDPTYKQLIDKIGTSDRDHGLISSSMSKIGPALGVNMSGYHDAITDCRITIEMFKKLIDFLEQNQSLDIRRYQNERIQKIKEKE